MYMAKKAKKTNKNKAKKVAKPATRTNAFRLQPLGDRVLLKELPGGEEKTASGIIIPVTADKDDGMKQGVVIAVGGGRIEDGKLIPVTLSAGDVVLYHWGESVKVDGETYVLVREGEIAGVLSK
jgi:chaperonin GroES